MRSPVKDGAEAFIYVVYGIGPNDKAAAEELIRDQKFHHAVNKAVRLIFTIV